MKRFLKIVLWAAIVLFALSNYIAAINAYSFTHFSTEKVSKTKSNDTLSFSKKLKILFEGIDNPRPKNDTTPGQEFATVKIKSNRTLECWYVKAIRAKGTVIMFHGYGASKSALVAKATEFYNRKYSILMVDFMGAGGSEGNETTIGYKEAEEVKTCYDYIVKGGAKNIFLFGSSMGAAAILKSVHDYNITPNGIILECPFGSMYDAVSNRFHNMGIPTFPFASMLTFWGGVENGFNAFSFKPSEYAKSVKCPTLLFYGAKDTRVTRTETDEIYKNLAGKKTLVVFPNAGHEVYTKEYEWPWWDSIRHFTDQYLEKSHDTSDTADLPAFRPIWGYRFVVPGNYSGTGRIDTLIEHYYSMARHRETNKYFDSVEYDDMVGLAVEQDPWSFVTSTNHKLDTLQINKNTGQLFGIAWMKNEGDLFGDGKDELSYVVNWADWSSMNTCHLVTYTKHGWKEIYSFGIRDWEIPDLPDYQVGYGLFGVAGGGPTDKDDSANIEAIQGMKEFSGFIKRVKPGIILVHTFTMDANDTILRVDLVHHTPVDSTIDAGFPKN